jgi:hypothetical protein
LGWKTFSAGVIAGFDKAIDVGTPIIKELTQVSMVAVTPLTRSCFFKHDFDQMQLCHGIFILIKARFMSMIFVKNSFANIV